MRPSDGRAGNIIIWLISGFFLTSILGGGCFLVLYIALPATKSTSWFPVAGIVLIGIPWAFWIILCVYLSIAGNLSRSPADRPSFKAATVAPASSSNGAESPVNSPGGARRVRFTNDGAGEQAGHEGDRGPSQDVRAADPCGEGSPCASRESEKPLTQSMSYLKKKKKCTIVFFPLFLRSSVVSWRGSMIASVNS